MGNTINIFVQIMRNNYHKWTEEEDKVLVQYAKDKIPTQTIANLLGLTTKQIACRFHYLRKRGIDVPKYRINWTPDLEKELVNLVSKNEGNLRNAFREFAEKYNVPHTVAETRWYNHRIPTGRLKDKKFCFGILGRFRGNANSKIYNKTDSKTHKFWKILKTIFD